MDEQELLKRYAETGDQEAFAQLVRGHGDWVYGAAKRQLGDEHLAEDVTQAVFLLLARKARRLRGYGYLGGWLVKAARYCVKEAKRERGRREKREKEVAAMAKRTGGAEASWDEVAVVLDDAVAGLRPADRDMVVMRFYQGMSFTEVGKASGIGEEAAKKRVQRAVEKLRGKLEKKGVTGTTAGLSAVLVGNVVGEMPAGLAAKIVSAVGSGGGNTAAAAIAKGAMKMMRMATLKVVVGVAVLIGGVGLTAATVRRESSGTPVVNEADPSAPGTVRVVRAKAWVDEKVAAAIRAAGKPVQTKSQWFEAMLVPTDALHRAMEPMRQTWPQMEVDMEGFFSGDPKLMWNSYGPAATGSLMGRTRILATLQSSQAGKYDLKARPGGLAMQLDMQDLQASYLTSDGSNKTQAGIVFDGEVPGGMTLVFLGGFQNEGVYCVDAWEAVRMTKTQARVLRLALDNQKWFGRTPAQWRSYADRLCVWQSRGKDLEKGDRLTQRLEGGEVRLLAISRPEKWPGCWWTPGGEPIADASGEPEHAGLVVVVRFLTGPGKKDDHVVYLHKWDRTNGATTFPDGEERVFELPDESGRLSLEIASTVWQRLGTVDQQHPLAVDAADVEIKSVDMAGPMCTVRLKYSHLPETAVRLVALDEGGQELSNSAIDNVVRLSGAAEVRSEGERYCNFFNVKSKPARFAVEMAPYQRVEFTGFVTTPKVVPPGTVSGSEVQQAESIEAERRAAQQSIVAKERAVKMLELWSKAKQRYDAVAVDDSTPQGLCKRMLEAAANGREEGVIGCFVPTLNEAQKQQARDFALLYMAIVRCTDAAAAKFGMEQLIQDQVNLPGYGKYGLMKYDWQITDDRAKTDNDMSLRRVDGHWRLETTGLVEQMVSRAVPWGKALEQIRADIVDGRIGTTKQLSEAIGRLPKP